MISRLLPLALALGSCLLTSCATFNDTELGIIRGSGVSPRIYAKMDEGHELRPEDVIELTRRHVPERYILRQIDDVGVDYVLGPDDYKRLERARVSPAVIDALVVASNQFSERYAAPRRRVYVGDPYYYGDPYLDGPPYVSGSVGIGFSSGRYHRHHRHR